LFCCSNILRTLIIFSTIVRLLINLIIVCILGGAMNKLFLKKALTILFLFIFITFIPASSYAAATSTKERLVLMPLRVSAEDFGLQGSMETALAEGLQLKYTVFSGEQVAQKAKEVFLKESRASAHKECDETRCMQDIASSFQAELISTANVTKQKDGYFLAVSIRNIFDNKVVYSNSLACKHCDSYQVVDKLKELGSGSASRIETKTFRDCPACPEMAELPAGSFKMGSSDGASAEKPVHPVNIAKPFAIGVTEVTQAQWKAIMGTRPSQFARCGDNCPVEKVSWYDAQDFVKELSAKTGKRYRLPSEAEWEYACRAGGQQRFCGSNTADSVGWFGAKSTPQGNSAESTNPVGVLQANAFGLYDMSGNVWEWVEDNYHDDYTGAPADGSVWRGKNNRFVLRGGSWYHGEGYLRAATRGGFDADSKNGSFGFRVARTLP